MSIIIIATYICITTTELWSVPDFRINQHFSIYRQNINVFNQFYASLDNYGLITRTTTYGNIFVSLENFLKFKKIYSASVNYYAHNRYINRPIRYINNINNYVASPHFTRHTSDNTKLKLQLADLIYDIKDNLSDAMYKEILEKIALISP